MKDTTLAIVQQIWKDLTDRRGFSMDEVSGATQREILAKWYELVDLELHPGCEPHAPDDILVRVRGW